MTHLKTNSNLVSLSARSLESRGSVIGIQTLREMFSSKRLITIYYCWPPASTPVLALPLTEEGDGEPALPGPGQDVIILSSHEVEEDTKVLLALTGHSHHLENCQDINYIPEYPPPVMEASKIFSKSGLP